MSFLPSNIKLLLKRHDLKSGEFADKMGWKIAVISSYTTGNTEPPLNKAMKMASFFEITVDDLVNKDLSKEPSVNMTSENNDRELTSLLKRLERQLDQVEKDKSVSDKKLLKIKAELKREFPDVYDKLKDE